MRKILKRFINKVELDETRYFKPTTGQLVNNWLYEWSNKEKNIIEKAPYDIQECQQVIILIWFLFGCVFYVAGWHNISLFLFSLIGAAIYLLKDSWDHILYMPFLKWDSSKKNSNYNNTETMFLEEVNANEN